MKRRKLTRDELEARTVNASEYIYAMATINPQLNNQHTSRVFIAEQNEGKNKPHMHVEFEGKRGRTVTAYVSLTEAAYSDHHRYGVMMTPKVKEEFLNVMTTLWMKHHVEENVYDEKGEPTGQTQLVPATGYEAAVQIWMDTWDPGSEARYQWDDKTGRAIMPNYEILQVSK